MKFPKKLINEAVEIWANRSLHEALEFIYEKGYSTGFDLGMQGTLEALNEVAEEE